MTDGRSEARIIWQAAYEEHGVSIMNFLVSRLRNREDAEDILQETFIRAIKATNALREKSKVRPYLFSIAHNLMVNHVRKKREVNMPISDETGANPMDSVEDDAGISPEADVTLRDLEENIIEIMNEMSPSHKKAFELGVLGQKPYSEVARLTGWTQSQVKINVYRARKKAIEELRDEWID
ncbi:MAG: RNA polymerase sigma factor [Candidatus Electryonea clarkiae]|nr:RNA polymerase sigma factor [Candidatus Electryonea clarkiae]MDP8289324.1 RNA polymerase sigma factor [Candidatus Electryonea clarkiae]